MNEFSSLPESISHKQLNSLLSEARRHSGLAQEQSNLCSSEEDAFEELITNWNSLSQELLKKLGKKNHQAIEKRSPKALMALGALEAHLKMAIIAKEASDLN